MADSPRFWAFLSYSHTDEVVARWLHKAVEAWDVPARLRGQPTAAGPAPRRFRPVFRDRDELAADPDLKARVVTNLAQSAWLILLCSPAAARSPWVAQEVREFKAVHGVHRILAVIVSGEPFASRLEGREAEECFPTPLRFRFGPDGKETVEEPEPVAADLRPGGDGRRLVILKLMAGMLGVGLDDLIRRAAQKRNRDMLVLSTGSIVLAIVMGGLAGTAILARNEARRERLAADIRRQQAENLVDFMLGDLRDRLDSAGRLDLLDAVGAKAMAFYGATASSGLSANEIGQRARVLHLLGDIRDRRGDQVGARTAFNQALAMTSAQLAAHPDDPQRLYDQAESAYWVGWLAFERGDIATADARFTQYKALADRLTSLDPSREAWRSEAAWADSNLQAARLMDGPAPDAIAAFSRSLRISANIARLDPTDDAKQMDYGNSLQWLASAHTAIDDLSTATSDLAAERAIYEKLLARHADDRRALAALAINRMALAELQGRAAPRDAVEELSQAVAEMETLLSAEPESAAWRAQAASAYVALSRALLDAGRAQAAADAARQAAHLAEALMLTDPGETRWRGSLLGSARNSALEAAVALARTADERRRALAAAPAEAQRLADLARTLPNHVTLSRVAAEAALLEGDYWRAGGRLDLARRAWTAALTHLDTIPPQSGGLMIGRGMDVAKAAKARLKG